MKNWESFQKGKPWPKGCLSSGLFHCFLNDWTEIQWKREEKKGGERKGGRDEKDEFRELNASLTKRRRSYLMLIIKAGFEHRRRFYYFPTPLEPSPCDNPPLHPCKLSAWAKANKNSPVRGKRGPATAPLFWWGDTSLCINCIPPSLPQLWWTRAGPRHKARWASSSHCPTLCLVQMTEIRRILL